MAHVVFTSYAQRDRDRYLERFVEEFREELQGIVVGRNPDELTFFDRDDVQAGDRWSAKIIKAVNEARVLLCLMSPAYFTRPWCGREVQAFIDRERRLPAAFNGGPFIVPIWWRMPPTPRPLPSRLGQFNYRDAGFPEAYAIDGVRGLARQRKLLQVSRVVDTLVSLVGASLARLDRVFRDRVLAKYPTIFKSNERLEMNGATLAYVVSEMQQYSLLDSSVDVKGVAYEEVVGSNLRGDRGEFFTPRNACRMAVKMINPQPGELVLDPASGTGGFLVIAMNHVLSIIDEKHRGRWPKRGASAEQQSELFRERHEYLSEKVYGLDLNPNLVRAAKMNMVMNNDGSGNLFQCNSLEHPHRWPADGPPRWLLGGADVIFANPPFGTDITIDDPRILAQFEVGSVWDPGAGGFVRRISNDGTPTLQSSQPPEVLFVERCLQFLKPGGRLAIVMPNGLLNNPGLAYFRQAILHQAQLLAVVDMHRDLFQPRNDTQTSMVLLRKWNVGESATTHGDYPIFMSIADAVGHNKRGATLYKRAADGSLLLHDLVTVRRVPKSDGTFEEVEIRAKEPIVDDELDEIADAYHRWLAERSTPARKRRGERA